MPIQIDQDPNGGGVRYNLPSAGHFAMPALDDSVKGKLPVIMFTGAAEKLDEAASMFGAITSDRALTDFGKEQKLAPIQKEAVLSIARLHSVLDVEERHWQKRETDLLAVPKIDPTNSVAAIEAREIRDWFRTLGPAERTNVMDSLGGDAENDVVTLALLRSPIQMLDWTVTEARKVWEKSRRLANPAEAMEIERGRSVLEWGRRGMGFLAALTRQVTKLSNDRIAQTVFEAEDENLHAVWKTFALDPTEVERAKANRIFAQQRKR